jgi:CRISPR system Cascade subunit CasA
MKFDVSTEPWLPVIRLDGKPDELGLCDVLIQAHQIRALVDPMPTVEFGLHRLLVAFVLDIFKPNDLEDWAGLWENGAFDEVQVKAYFAENAGCFDLFDAHRPFLQSPGMEGEKSKPLAGLLPSMPSGTATNHFHHGHEHQFGVSLPIAARLLTTIAPWMTAGGAGLSPSLNGAPPFYVLPLGKNLLQTLLLNTLVLKELSRASGEEIPAWRDSVSVTATRATDASLLASFSWRPRRIQLQWDESGICAITGQPVPHLVSAMKFAPGFGAGFEWIDPNCAFRIGEERLILRPRENREVWRDTGPLVLLREKSWQSKNGKISFERPAIITQLGELISERILSPDHEMTLAVYAVRTDLKMKTFEWGREILQLPFPLLQGQRAAIEAQSALEDAESVAFALRRAIKLAYPREGKGNDAAFAMLAATSERGFWRELRPHFDDYLEFLARSNQDAEREEERQKWRNCLRKFGWEAITVALDDMDSNAVALERQTTSYKNFRDSILPTVNPEKAAEWAKKAKSKKAKVTPTPSGEQLSLI